MSQYVDLTNETGFIGDNVNVDYLTVNADAVIGGTLTLSGVAPSTMLTLDAARRVAGVTLTPNRMLGTNAAGVASTTGMTATVAGTVLTLDAPQDIKTTATPTFAGTRLTGLSAIRPVFTDGAKNLVSTGAINNGQLIIGRTGFAPAIANLTGTTDQIWIIDGGGSITISTPQNIATRSSPTFAGMTINSLAATAGITLATTGGSSAFGRTDGIGTQITDVSGGGYVRIATATVSTNNNTLDDGAGGMIASYANIGNLTPSLPVKCDAGKLLVSGLIDLTSEITGMLPIANGGSGASAFVGNRLLYSNAGTIAEATPLSDGQMFIGRTGLSPIAATLTGTANRVSVANASGSITLSCPQDIHTGAFPQFAGMTLTTATTTSAMYLTTTSGTSNFTRDVNGTQMQHAAGNSYVRIDAGNKVSTANVTLDDGFGTTTAAYFQSRGLTPNMPVKSNGAKVLVNSLIDLTTDVTGVLPVVNGGTGSGTWVNNRMLYSNAGAIAETAALSDGQLIIGRSGGLAPIVGNLIGTANRVIVTNSSGAITLSLPQDVNTTAWPTFTNVRLSNLTAIRPVFTDNNNDLISSGPIGDGQLIIGVSGGLPVIGTLTGTPNQIDVTTGPGTIRLSLPSQVAISTSIISPIFLNINSCYARIDDVKSPRTNIPNATWTLIDWLPTNGIKKTWSLNSGGMLDNVANVTIPTTGAYTVTAQLRLDDYKPINTNDSVGIAVWLNGSVVPDGEVFYRPDGDPGRRFTQITTTIPAIAGQVINFYAMQVSGTAVPFKWLTFSVVRIA